MPDVAVASPAPPVEVDRRALRREILLLAWPVVLQALLRTMMFWADTAMLGRHSKAAVAAVAIVGPVAHSLNMILSALGAGALATVSRATGARNLELQERETATAILLSVLLGAVLLVVAVPCFPHMADLVHMPDDPTLGAVASRYLHWIVLAVPFMLLDSTCSAALRGAGDTRTPMLFAVAANLLNVAGNYILIFGKLGAPAMGVAGAGLSTAVAIALEGTLLAAWLFTPWSRVRLRWRSFAAVTRDSVLRLVKVSLPAALEPLLLQSGFLLFIFMMAKLGTDAMAAHRSALAAESMSFMPGWGFSIACGALVGQSLGAKRPDRAAAGLRESGLLAFWIMTVLGAIFAIFPGPILRFFLPGAPEVERIGITCLRIAAVEQPLMALALVMGGALRGAGDTRSPVYVAMVGVWCVRLPLAWVFAFPLGFGIVGAWIVMVIDWAARAAVFAWVWRRGRWRTLKL